MTVTLSRPPVGQRLGDEGLGGGVAGPGLLEDRRDIRVLDHLGQAVGAEQEVVAVHELDGSDLGLDAGGGTADEVGQHVPLGVAVDVLGLDRADPGEFLGHRVVAGEPFEPPVPVDVGPRVAHVDDEDVDSHAVGEGQGGPHPPQTPVGPGLADQRVVDLAEVLAHPGDELAGLFLVDLGGPSGRVQDQLDARPDGKLAGLLAGGHPPHPVGDHHPVGHVVDRLRQFIGRHVRIERAEGPAHPRDQVVVLVVLPGLPGIGDRGELEAYRPLRRRRDAVRRRLRDFKFRGVGVPRLTFHAIPLHRREPDRGPRGGPTPRPPSKL